MNALQEILDVTRLKLDRHENLFITPKFDISLIVNTINDFFTMPADEYLLLFADLSDSYSKNALYITNKTIIRITDEGASEIGLEKIRKIMLDGPDSSLMLNNTRFFNFPDNQHMADVVIEFLADLQNAGISSINLSRTEARYPKFSDILDAVIEYYEKKKDSPGLEALYFKFSDTKFEKRIEEAIAKVKKSGNRSNQWEFFDEDGKKIYSTDKIKDVAEKVKTRVIKPDHLVLRNGMGEKKPVYEVLPHAEQSAEKAKHAFARIRNSSFIVGGIVGLILGVVYYFMLQDKYEVQTEFLVGGLVAIALGFISYAISRRKDTHPAFKWVGISLLIAGAGGVLYGMHTLLIAVLAFTAGTAILSVVVAWIVYQRNKPETVQM